MALAKGTSRPSSLAVQTTPYRRREFRRLAPADRDKDGGRGWSCGTFGPPSLPASSDELFADALGNICAAKGYSTFASLAPMVPGG